MSSVRNRRVARPREERENAVSAKIVVFALDRTDPRVDRRLRGLRATGVRVVCFSFARRRGAAPPEVGPSEIDLGTTYDRRYGQRAFAVARAMVRVWRNRAELDGADRFYAINPDNALLALAARLIARSHVPVAVEISDVQPIMVGPGMGSSVLRRVEHFVLNRSDLLVTSSPAYVDHYFKPIHGRSGGVFLLENKVYPRPRIPVVGAAEPAEGSPWMVGWFGALNCARSWEIVREVASRLHGRVDFVLGGFPTFLDLDTFVEQVRQTPGVSYQGPYRYPDDLPGLYGQVHLAWALDFTDPTGNSKWCLPNRLYEGGSAGVPVLTQSDTEAGSWVDRNHTGWNLDEDIAAGVISFFDSLSIESWTAMKEAIATCPEERFYGDADYRSLVETLGASKACHPTPVQGFRANRPESARRGRSSTPEAVPDAGEWWSGRPPS